MAILGRMGLKTNEILSALAPYAVGIFFYLLVAIAWAVAFVKLKHVGALVLAFASLTGSILSAASGVMWVAVVVQGQNQLIQFFGILNLGHHALVACLMILGALLIAFHRPVRQEKGAQEYR
jgi:hypothetical protein